MFTRQMALLAALALLPDVTRAGPAPPAGITVRLYNTARIDSGVQQDALAVAARTLAASRLDIRWSMCDVDVACRGVPVHGELIVRLVRGSETIDAEAALVLGEASIGVGTARGVLATVYVDRVETMAARWETDAALLLGRAIAHEVGHLLLATNTHSHRGLMRPRWLPDEIRRNHAADWILTKEESEAIRRRIR
jgi:hypothetical protein